MTNARKAIIK